MLEIKNLHARIAEDGTEIIRGLNLTVKAGEVAAIMGPNGSGKSTLSYILAGRDDYEVTEGDILYNGESILELDPSERAAKGIFLAFQYPVEIPGVATMQFLKVAMNEQRKARGEEELKTPTSSSWSRKRPPASKSTRTCSSVRSMSGSPAARRSAPRSCR
jgi:Fe-S cluster assembly ATP-binding protein